MRAITVRPAAAAALLRARVLYRRTRPPAAIVGTWIAIHVSGARTRSPHDRRRPHRGPTFAPHSRVVALAHIVGDDRDDHGSKWHVGDVLPVQAGPCRGCPGLWSVDAATERQIVEQIPPDRVFDVLPAGFFERFPTFELFGGMPTCDP